MYMKRFEYEDDNNTLQVMMLKPLKIDKLGDLWKVLKDMKISKEGNVSTEEVLSIMTKENVDILTKLCLDTVERSSLMTGEEANYFTSTHFMELFPLIISLNLNPKGK